MSHLIYWCIVCEEESYAAGAVEFGVLKRLGLNNIVVKPIEMFGMRPFDLARIWVSSRKPSMDSFIRLGISSRNAVWRFDSPDNALLMFPEDRKLVDRVTPNPHYGKINL